MSSEYVSVVIRNVRKYNYKDETTSVEQINVIYCLKEEEKLAPEL